MPKSPYADPSDTYPNMDPAVVPEGAVPPFVPDPKAVKAQAELDRQAKEIFEEMESVGSLGGVPGIETAASHGVDSWKLSQTLAEFTAQANPGKLARLLHALGCDGLPLDSPEVKKALSDRRRLKAQGCATYCPTNTRFLAVVLDESRRRAAWSRWVNLHARAHGNGAFKFNHSNGHAALGLPQPPLAGGRYAGDPAWDATTHHVHQASGETIWYARPVAPTIDSTVADVAELRAQVAELMKGRKA